MKERAEKNITIENICRLPKVLGVPRFSIFLKPRKMADILTNLRELSVAFFLSTPSQEPQSITPQLFTKVCNKNITNCNIAADNIASNNLRFNQSEMATINNGYKLAMELGKILGTSKIPAIKWVGNQRESNSPEDLIVNDFKISLKEDSYILENMGLYKLLNIISNSDLHQRGLNVFETFANKKLCAWYEKTRDLLISLGPNEFIHSGSNYTSKGILVNDNLSLEYGASNKSIIKNFSKSTYNDFMTKTNSKTREKVFSKWINKDVKQSPMYIQSKSECSQTAGLEIVNKYKKYIGTSNKKLLRLFRIHNYPYFYCKTTASSVEIYEVPSIQESLNKIVINKFYYKVPTSQLNIFTEILNTENKKSLLFRNELRYSHGQFNGTPEAKLYHERGGDLSVIYSLRC